MAPKLFMTDTSPSSKTVQIVANAIGLHLEIKEVDTTKQENFTPAFLEINPQHALPTLVDDDGFTIWDSHAIIIYLVSRYAKDDSLYPDDIRKRAVVDQRLHFESGIVFPRLLNIISPIFMEGKKIIDENDENNALEIYDFLESFLEGRRWIAGDSVTIADYSLITTVKLADEFIPVPSKNYPKLVAWIKNVEDLPVYEVNRKGHDLLTANIRKVMHNN